MFDLRLDEFGREIADGDKVELPFGWERPIPLAERLRALVRQEMSRAAAAQGMETFEEADDFDVPDEEGDFVSPYEIVPMTPEEGQDDADGPDGGGSSSPAQKTAPEASTGSAEASSGGGNAPPSS